MKNIILVSEFEKIYYDDAKPFKKKHWEALGRYIEKLNKSEEKRLDYFRVLSKGIQFTNFVGVIQAGNLTIEVLPKIDGKYTTARNEDIKVLAIKDHDTATSKSKWHKVLLDMLKECRLLRINHVDNAMLNIRSNSILDIYFELFLDEAEKLLHEGLIKKYYKQEGNQTALKGQIVFPKQIACNSIHAERFYVRYSTYNRDNIFNQILYKTLCLIPEICYNSFLLDRCRRLLLNFPELSNCSVNEETFLKLKYERKSERYKEAMLISKMLLLNFRPDIAGGVDNVIAILFDMNRLWEEFIYRRLKKEEAAFGVTVVRQESRPFWQPKESSRSKKVRPDIVIRKPKDGQTIIIDTKWKLVGDLLPGDADLKQMYVYNLFWDCKKSVLLYPANQIDHNKGHYFDFNDNEQPHTDCVVLTFNILNTSQAISSTMGHDLMEALSLL